MADGHEPGAYFSPARRNELSDFEFDIDDILAEFKEEQRAESSKLDESFKLQALSSKQEESAEPQAPSYKQEPRYEEPPETRRYPKESQYAGETVAYTPEREAPRRKPVQEKLDREKAYEVHPVAGDSTAKRVVHGFFGLIFAVISLAVLGWAAINIHPATSTATFTKGYSSTNLITRVETLANNSKADSLSGLTTIKKVYKIPENDLVAPKPDSSCYGRLPVSRAAEVLQVVDKAKASGLLDRQEVVFSTDVNFFPDDDILYYCDDSILVICWKEWIEGRVCSCVEIKVADGSQFRRKLMNDTYGDDSQDYASNIANSVNAVVAFNADFYAFRDLGITVYQRQVYRFNEFVYTGFYQAYNSTDTLFINTSGDFLFFRRGDQTTKEELQQWVNDNDVLFAIAFGPVLIDDGQVQYTESYPIGEINMEYSRAGLGQVDKLHYLYMTVSHSDYNSPRCTVNEFAEFMSTKNLQKAYCFDGGQTGEIVFNGEPYNHIDFGAERTVTDIIYFASAIPN